MQMLRSVIGPEIDRLAMLAAGSSDRLQNAVPVDLAGTAEDERSGDGAPPDLTVSRSDARSTARDVLVPPPEGQWELNEQMACPGDDRYSFVFLLTETDWSGRARVCVDGSTNRPLGIKREVYPPTESDELPSR